MTMFEVDAIRPDLLGDNRRFNEVGTDFFDLFLGQHMNVRFSGWVNRDDFRKGRFTESA